MVTVYDNFLRIVFLLVKQKLSGGLEAMEFTGTFVELELLWIR